MPVRSTQNVLPSISATVAYFCARSFARYIPGPLHWEVSVPVYPREVSPLPWWRKITCCIDVRRSPVTLHQLPDFWRGSVGGWGTMLQAGRTLVRCPMTSFGFLSILSILPATLDPRVLATDPEVRVRFPALRDFLRSSGSGTGSTQPREYKCGATRK
jgi:hypothetical protein